MNKINVLLVVGKMMNGGVESFCLNYAEQLSSECHFTFLAFDNSIYVPETRIHNMDADIVYTPKVTSYLSFCRAFKKILKQGNYDIVHSNMNTFNPFILRVAKKCHVKKRINHAHSMTSKQEPLRNFIKNILRLFSHRYATDYFACGEAVAKWNFGKRYFSRVKIVKNAIDYKRFCFDEKKREIVREQLNVKENEILIGHIGRFMTTKNATYIVDLASRAQLNNKPFKFVLIGDGELKDKVLSKITENRLKNITILNSCADIEKYYSAFDIFILPSLYEGLPVTGVEAQANGLYCLFSDNISREALFAGHGEYLSIKSSDIDLWLDSIEKNAKKRFPNRESIIENGYEIRSAANELIKLYKSN